MIPFLSNAFNDPSDPWYYVIGIIFLLLIFGALAVYIVWFGKKNKNANDSGDSAEASVDKNEDKEQKTPITKSGENSDVTEQKDEIEK